VVAQRRQINAGLQAAAAGGGGSAQQHGAAVKTSEGFEGLDPLKLSETTSGQDDHSSI